MQGELKLSKANTSHISREDASQKVLEYIVKTNKDKHFNEEDFFEVLPYIYAHSEGLLAKKGLDLGELHFTTDANLSHDIKSKSNHKHISFGLWDMKSEYTSHKFAQLVLNTYKEIKQSTETDNLGFKSHTLQHKVKDFNLSTNVDLNNPPNFKFNIKVNNGGLFENIKQAGTYFKDVYNLGKLMNLEFKSNPRIMDANIFSSIAFKDLFENVNGLSLADRTSAKQVKKQGQKIIESEQPKELYDNSMLGIEEMKDELKDKVSPNTLREYTNFGYDLLNKFDENSKELVSIDRVKEGAEFSKVKQENDNIAEGLMTLLRITYNDKLANEFFESYLKVNEEVIKETPSTLANLIKSTDFNPSKEQFESVANEYKSYKLSEDKKSELVGVNPDKQFEVFFHDFGTLYDDNILLNAYCSKTFDVEDENYINDNNNIVVDNNDNFSETNNQGENVDLLSNYYSGMGGE